MTTFLDTETILKALKNAAWMAEHGTREEKSGRFLPPPGWKGQLITGTAADRLPPPPPRKKRA